MDDIEAGSVGHQEVSSLSAAEASSRTERILRLVMACALAGILIIEVILGRTDDAIACFMKARELMPGNAAIETNLRIACEKRQKDKLGKGAI